MTGNVTQAAFAAGTAASGVKNIQVTGSGNDFKKVMDKLNTGSSCDDGTVVKTKIDNGRVRDNLKESLINDTEEKAVLNEGDTMDLAEDIKDTVKKVLDMSDEEFEQTMSALGFTIADLLIPQNLVSLIAEFNGASSLEMITDDKLTSLLSELGSSIRDIVCTFMDNHNVDMDTVAEALNGISNQEVHISEADADDSFGSAVSTVTGADDDAIRKDDSIKVPLMTAPESETAVRAQDDDSESADGIKVEIENYKTPVTDNASGMYDDGGSTEEKEHDNRREDNAGIILNSLSESVNSAPLIDTVAESARVDGVDIVRQIVDAVKVRITESVQSMEISLNPEHLGKVSLNVASRDGIITASIAVQNESVKAAIENQITMLKEQLDNQGIKVQEVEVTVSSHAFDSNMDNGGQENGNSKSNARRKFRGIEEISEEGISNDAQDNLTDSNINLRA